VSPDAAHAVQVLHSEGAGGACLAPRYRRVLLCVPQAGSACCLLLGPSPMRDILFPPSRIPPQNILYDSMKEDHPYDSIPNFTVSRRTAGCQPCAGPASCFTRSPDLHLRAT
jgi:hypothetical protein